MSTKKIFVTGCCGFIGSHLVEALCADGHQVVGIDWMKFFEERKEINRKILLNLDGFRFIEGDICHDLPDEEFDVVVHLAALPGVRASIDRPRLTMEANVGGTANILKWASEGRCSSIVYASSSSVYGLSKRIPWTEDDPLASPNSPYAASKVATEVLASTYCRLFDIKAIGLRFFTVYGPRGREDMAMHKFLTWVSEGEELTMFGDGTSSRDYTFVEDIVQGINGAINYIDDGMRLQEHDVFNLGNNTPHELKELISIVEQTTDSTARIIRLPDQLGDVPTTFANIEKSKNILGYNPDTSLRDGVRKTWDSMQTNQK